MDLNWLAVIVGGIVVGGIFATQIIFAKRETYKPKFAE